MKTTRWVARLLCSTAIVIVGTYTVLAAAVAFFIVTGTLTPGQTMIYDSNTPTLVKTMLFMGAGSVIVACFAFTRHKLTQRS